VRIFHIATAADWAEARRTGSYTTSSRGRTLAEEGFIHGCRRDQVGGVFRRYYADAREPLVLLTIETERLESPWREDPVGDDTFPHVYGPLSPKAVVSVEPLDRRGGTPGFTTIFVREMLLRGGLAVGAMLLAGLGSVIGKQVSDSWGELTGALVGLLVGIALVVVVLRRRA
jgi:uncharacterized protein (DUF952 family)